MRPVPRSFVLPRSAQSEQVSYRRWNSAYGMLRTASVVVSLLLVLFFSGDALIGQWMAPGLAPSVQVERAVEESEAAREAPAAEALPTMAPAEPEAAAPRGAAEAPVAAAPAPMAVATSPEITVVVEKEVVRPPAMAPGIGGGESVPSLKVGPPAASVPQTSGARAVGAPPAPQPMFEAATPGGATPAGVMLYKAPASVATAVERLEELSPAPGATALSDLLQAARTPLQTPAEAELILRRALDTPLPSSAEITPPQRPDLELSPWWNVWRSVRVASGVLLGALLMLVAALVWAGQKRRL